MKIYNLILSEVRATTAETVRIFFIMSGIYKITSPSGRVYIGQSVNIKNRFCSYRGKFPVKQIRLCASFIKHGTTNHIFETIEVCEKENLNERERYWQDFYNVLSSSGLNCVLTKTNEKRFVMSDELRKQIADKVRGHTQNLGRKHSFEARQRMSLAQKGVKRSAHTIELLRIANLGRKLSLEHKKKLRENSTVKRIVLDVQMGIYYYSTKEVVDAFGIKQSTLITKLNGYRKNNTQFIYADPWLKKQNRI